MSFRRVFTIVIQPPQTVVTVDLIVDDGWGFAHPRSRELPIVSGIERGPVEN